MNLSISLFSSDLRWRYVKTIIKISTMTTDIKTPYNSLFMKILPEFTIMVGYYKKTKLFING